VGQMRGVAAWPWKCNGDMNWQAFKELRSGLGRPLVMAHRGASAILPENTLSAFSRAVADGADILETDLRFTKDDEIVLIHDETLDRTVEGTGFVRDYTLAELKQLKVKPMANSGVLDEPLPSLKDLIEATEGQVPLALELKDPLFAQPNYAQKLIAILRDYDLLDRCVVISFSLDRVQTVKQLCDRGESLATGWITLSNLSPNQPVEFLGPFWPLLFLNPFYVSYARKLGKIVCPLDPNPISPRLGLYLKVGFDAIITDHPAVTLQAITRKIGR
jgi:glycerophosphoryl diester phosphodiesterase